jgi:hypothetical protein
MPDHRDTICKGDSGQSFLRYYGGAIITDMLKKRRFDPLRFSGLRGFIIKPGVKFYE